MTSEDDKRLIEEAKGCEGCIGWLKHCQAECCKIVFVDISVEKLNECKDAHIKISARLSYDRQKYYALRDVRYKRNTLFFLKSRMTVLNGRVAYVHPCAFLRDNMCIRHPDGKPDICKALNNETAKKDRQAFVITKNCLYRYKNMEVI